MVVYCKITLFHSFCNSVIVKIFKSQNVFKTLCICNCICVVLSSPPTKVCVCVVCVCVRYAWCVFVVSVTEDQCV